MIRLVYAAGSEPLDGIRNYAENCCQALVAHERLPAQVELWGRDNSTPTVDRGDVFVLQYNPFSYGRRGIAPWLVRRVRAIRRSRTPVQIVLVVHEAFVPARSVRWALMGGWQRLQLAAIGRQCDVVVVSTEAWEQPVRRLLPKVPIHHVPVGSNLPDQRAQRPAIRGARGWDDQTLVIGTFGADPSARLGEFAREAITRVAQARAGVVVSALGARPLALRGFDASIPVHQPGIQPSEQLAGELAALDIFLAPFEDGVSARRTTLAAALQHELPVVGTRGRNTDSYLRTDSRLVLANVEDVESFARAASELAIDSVRRQDLRRAARSLFDERFSWPTVARDLAAVLSHA